MNLEFFKNIVNMVFETPSPSGYYVEINPIIKQIVNNIGYICNETPKGNLKISLDGLDNKKRIAVSAHVDTLGLMVRSINSDGTLNLTSIGGPLIPTLDGEYCNIITRSGMKYEGTIISKSPAIHVYKDSSSLQREIDNIVVRIDEVVNSKDDVLKLGIDNGDYVTYDPKTIITKSSFLKSRFIDDKASVCIILSVLDYMKKNNIKPSYDVDIYFTNYEEVGHGGSAILKCDELLAVDMGCIGLDLSGDEYSVSICAKDSSGPFNYELTNKLINLAKENSIKYKIDIFPFYGSDAAAALKGGVDCKTALIGTGVCASHGMERTHLDGITNTMKLLYSYLTSR